jgi:hypothetical protein
MQLLLHGHVSFWNVARQLIFTMNSIHVRYMLEIISCEFLPMTNVYLYICIVSKSKDIPVTGHGGS